MFAAHLWLRDDDRSIPLDVLIYKLVKTYLHATPFKRVALKVLLLQTKCLKELFVVEPDDHYSILVNLDEENNIYSQSDIVMVKLTW